MGSSGGVYQDITGVRWHLDDPEPIIYGDVNNNGTVDIGDVILVLRHIVGLIDLEQEFGPEAVTRADVTGTGNVNINDAILIMQYIIGLIDEFPVEQ